MNTKFKFESVSLPLASSYSCWLLLFFFVCEIKLSTKATKQQTSINLFVCSLNISVAVQFDSTYFCGGWINMRCELIQERSMNNRSNRTCTCRNVGIKLKINQNKANMHRSKDNLLNIICDPFSLSPIWFVINWVGPTLFWFDSSESKLVQFFFCSQFCWFVEAKPKLT